MDIDKIIRICDREDISPTILILMYLYCRNPKRNKKGQETDRKKAEEYSHIRLSRNYIKLDHEYFYFDDKTNDWEVKPKVQKWFYDDVSDYSKEIWELYPRKLKVGDNEFISKNLSLAKFSKRFKAKKLSEEQKKLVLEITDWAVKNNELKVGMIKFLELDLWESLYQDMSSKTNKAKHISNLTIL